MFFFTIKVNKNVTLEKFRWILVVICYSKKDEKRKTINEDKEIKTGNVWLGITQFTETKNSTFHKRLVHY